MFAHANKTTLLSYSAPVLETIHGCWAWSSPDLAGTSGTRAHVLFVSGGSTVALVGYGGLLRALRKSSPPHDLMLLGGRAAVTSLLRLRD